MDQLASPSHHVPTGRNAQLTFAPSAQTEEQVRQTLEQFNSIATHTSDPQIAEFKEAFSLFDKGPLPPLPSDLH